MTDLKKEICRIKVDQLMISGGINSEGLPSLSLGMPSKQKKGEYIILNIIGAAELFAIMTWSAALLKEGGGG